MSKNEIDSRITALWGKVESTKKDIEIDEELIRKEWLTKTVYVIRGITFNLKIESKNNIIEKLAEIILMKDSFNKALDILETSAEFKIGVDSFDNIVLDFKKRIKSLELKEKKAKLQKLLNQIETIVPEDVKKEKLLKELESQFNEI